MTVSLTDARSTELYARALQRLPGGVNSPVRAMRAIGRDPVFVERGHGAELFDVHVHVGRDIDGFTAPYDDLVSFLQRYGFERAFAFCMDEPDRHPGFQAPNDRTLAAAERSAIRSTYSS